MKNKLIRNLSLLDVFCLSSGAMISSGIFILPGLAYGQAGPLVFISYLLAGLLALLGTLSVIELSTAMPKAGGDYFFITRSLGPLVGTMSSFLSWSALCLKSAFAIFGIAEILFVTMGFPVMISSFLLCCFFVTLNMLGVKEATKFEVLLVLILYGIMLFLVVMGMGKFSIDHFQPLLLFGFNRVLVTAGFVFISFGGLLNIASLSGEIKDPVKNIPRGMILSLVAVTVFYAAILLVIVGGLPGDTLAASLTPVADTGRVVFGQFGYIIVSIAALLAFITTANAGILSASRYPLALSEDKLLPDIFGKLAGPKKSPILAILLTGAFIFLSLLLDLETLVKMGSVVILTLYFLTNLAVIILREGKIQNYRPAFRVPFYPWTNVVAMILFLILLIDMGFVAIEISLAIVVFSILLFILYGRKRHQIGYALVHLLERIVDKQLTHDNLEQELKQVIIHRDDLKIDRFHRLVDDALVMDIAHHVAFDDFLMDLSKKVADDISLEQQEVYDLFKKRENEGSTAFTSFVALPHIIIPGENKFKLVIVRCRNGIEFNPEKNSVKAVFVLFGTKNERAFHLQALSAIAQIVQSKRFENTWMMAKDDQRLKDIVLLGDRIR